MMLKKIICIVTSLLLSFLVINSASAGGKKYLVTPFENFSQYKSRTEYDVYTLDTQDQSKRIKRTLKIDQYSESARSLIENKVKEMRANVIERPRIDKIINELNINKEKVGNFINGESAIEIGKLVGANFIIIGTILSIQTREEEINAYGLNKKIKSTICTTRIRIINIEYGKIEFSEVAKGRYSTYSSNYGKSSDNDPAYSALEDSINILANSDRFIKILKN